MLSSEDEKELRKWARAHRARGELRASQVVELFVELDRLRGPRLDPGTESRPPHSEALRLASVMEDDGTPE